MNIQKINEALVELVIMEKPKLSSRNTLLDVYKILNEQKMIDDKKIIKIHEKLNKALLNELQGYLIKQPNGLIAIPTILKIVGELNGLKVIW